jgi:hypothetical protein
VLLFGLSLTLLSTLVLGEQSSPPKRESPVTVVKGFLEMETNGGRLTPDGWEKANALFFVRPVAVPKKRIVVVISKDYSVDEIAIRANKAVIYHGYMDLGTIDSMLRYHAPDPRLLKTATLYHLIFADTHLQSRPNESTAERTYEWKIEDPVTGLWLDVESAVRYVADVRRGSKDPIVAKNADQTIEVLKHLP